MKKYINELPGSMMIYSSYRILFLSMQKPNSWELAIASVIMLLLTINYIKDFLNS